MPCWRDERAGERGTDDGGQWLGEVEQGQDLAPVAGGHPQAQEQDRAGEEAGFGDAEQDAQGVEAFDVLDEGEHQRDDAPATP